MTWTLLATLAAGLVLLVLGAELLVRGASRLATAAGISPLVVGLTVVAFGTSAPELTVSVTSALAGEADIALGNVVGSNIFNVLFILGVSALITPLVISKQLVRLDVPLMIGVSLLLLILALDGGIGRLDGAILFVGILGYAALQIVLGRRDDGSTAAGPGGTDTGSPTVGPGAATFDRVATFDGAATAAEPPAGSGWLTNVVLVLGGLALLVLGSEWLVTGATSIASALGVSELVIGLTIVAAGTSLPEVATSVLASIRGERDIAVGNVVGSNIFNILAVLGLSGLVAPEGVAVVRSAVTFDIPIMIAVAVSCLPLFFTGYLIARWEGALFLGYYVAYTAYLVVHAIDHPVVPAFETAMLYFVLPLTLVTLVVVGVRGRSGVGAATGD